MKKLYMILLFSLLICSENIFASETPKPVSPQPAYQKTLSASGGMYGFIENKGQIYDQNYQPNQQVKFLLNMRGLNVLLKSNSFSYDTYITEQKKKTEPSETSLFPNQAIDDYDVTYKFHRIDIEFIGANPNPIIVSENSSNDFMNYFNAITPESGAAQVRHFGKVTYKELYPNIDLEFTAKPGTSKPVEYNFIVHPGADVSLIQWKYKGSKNLMLIDGKIQIQTSNGNLYESIPRSFEKETNKEIKVSYKNSGDGLFAFNVKGYNHQVTLIIDPKPDLKYATYYGGAIIDYGQGITSDVADNMYLTGMSTSTTAIATTGAYQTTFGGVGSYGSLGDAFIVKFNSSGVRQWATYYGGTGSDIGQGIKVDNSGNIYIEGMTTSTTGMSTTGAFQAAFGGSTYYDVFLAKFSSSGARLWSTYYGGTGNDRGNPNCIQLDSAGNVYIAGTNNTASSTAITTTGAYQTTNGSTSAYDEPFVAKFSPSGAIIFGTYFGGGGSFHDQCYALALDASNNVYMTGACTSTSGFTFSGTHQATLGGGTDAYIVKINSTGTALLWATYYGGSLGEVGTGITVDANGYIMVSGYTAGSTAGIASTGAFQTTFGGGTYDGFIARFNSAGVRQWGTYYGGTLADIPRTGKMDASGNTYIAGDIASAGLATTGAYQTTIAGANDAFIAKFNAAGVPQLVTYYGGTLEDMAFNIDLDGRGNLYLTGRTVSTAGIVTTGAHQTTYGGGTYDAFATKFQEQGVGNNASVTALTSPIKFCAGNQAIKVKIKNNGVNRIDSVLVNWELDATLQTPVMCRVILDTIGGVLRNDTIVTLSNSVTFTQNISRTIRVWTTLPNNAIDTVNTDDTIFVTTKAGLAGTYSIDPSWGDYTSFTSAVYDLNNYGHCGPIIFNVTPAISFTEPPVIITRSGTVTDSIVFKKAYAAANPVLYGKSGTGSNDAVITLVGASYITFDGIDVADSISNVNATTQIEFGYGITNASSTVGSSNNRIKNCKVILRRTNTATIGIAQSTFMAAASSLSGGNHNNRYENIRIENSYNGILLSGTAAFPDSNNVITSAGTDSTIVGGTAANDIGNGTAIVYGIQAVEQKNLEISKTTVRNLTHTSTLLPSGIWLNNVSTSSDYGKARIFNNIINNLSRTSTTATGGFTGIRIDVSPNATAVVYNNLIYGLSTANPTAASATFLLRGIAQGLTASNGNAEYYNNSVYINSSSTNGSFTVFSRAGTGSSTYKNNIFSCVVGAQSGTAKHYAVYVSGGTIADASNNVLWAPNTNGFPGFTSSDRATLPIYAAAISTAAPSNGNERGSANADPNFTGINDLSFSSSTPASGSGTQIINPPITSDIFGNSRSSTNPTIGAIETSQTQIDSSAPVISNVIINNSSTPSIFATISDNSNSVIAGDVRLWYRSGTTGAFTGLYPDTFPSGTINGIYKWTSFSSLSVGSYQFYIAVRDLSGQGLNIAVNPIQNTSFTSFGQYDPVNFASNPDAGVNTRTFVKTTALAGGIYTVGPTGTYAKLTNVATALNTNALTGNVIFELQSTYDGTTGETFPIVFNQLMTSGGNWKATIRPATGVTARVTSGDPGSANPLIQLNGTDRLTFDGRPGGTSTSSEWTFRNTRTAVTFSSVFSLLNDASFDTLQYLKIESQNTTATSGTIEILGTNLTDGNDNNVIRYNEIRDRSDVSGQAANAIYSTGTAAFANDSNIVDNNKIYNWTATGLYVTPNGNGSGWKITNNSFYSIGTATTVQTCIRFEAGTTSVKNRITGNFIGGSAANSSGSAWFNSGNIIWEGIVCNAGNNDSSYIQNNTIQNLNLSGTIGASYTGIELTGGLISVTANTIGHNTTTNSIQTTHLGNAIGIWLNNSATVANVYENIIANVNASGNTNAGAHNGIRVTNAALVLIIRNNIIHDLTAANPSAGTSTPALAGIFTLHTGTSQTISNNTIYNLSSLANAQTNIFGINISNASASGSISDNKIFGLNNTSTTSGAQISGIHLDACQSFNVVNNFISLGYNVDSSAMISGINDKSNATNNNIYYNTVLISGNATSPYSTSSQAYRRTTLANTNLRNNIFKNTRTGNGAHYAVANAVSPPTVGWTANYNVLSSANSAQLGLWYATSTTFAAWKTTSMQDSASVNYSPVFVSSTDLHLSGTSLGNFTLAGTQLSGFNTDIDGQTRHSIYPYMGADESITNPLPVELLDISAQKIKDNVFVNWSTASEVNSDYFEVERSTVSSPQTTVNSHWSFVGKVKGQGNTNTISHYTFNDNLTTNNKPAYRSDGSGAAGRLQTTNILFYRLKMFDKDGSFAYSKIVSVTEKNVTKMNVEIFPNPFSNQIILNFSDNESNLNVDIIDINGKQCFHSNYSSNNIVIDNLDELPSGFYFVKVTSNDEVKVVKLLKN